MCLQTAPHICRLVDKSGAKLIHSNSTTAHLVGGVAAERTNRPALWHCRDMISLDRIAPQLAAKATRVLAISACVASQLEKDGVPAEKISVVYNGLDPNSGAAKTIRVCAKPWPCPTTPLSLASSARWCRGKTTPISSKPPPKWCSKRAWSNARFVSIGGDLFGEHADYISELRLLVKKHDLIDRFNFIPRQSDAVDAISALDCLVHPASDEPFGRVLMEAMAWKFPLSPSTKTAPWKSSPTATTACWCRPNAPDELAEAMTRVYRDAELRGHLQSNGARNGYRKVSHRRSRRQNRGVISRIHRLTSFLASCCCMLELLD